MPTLADFFLGMFYLLAFSIVLAVCLMIVGAALTEVRKRWPQ